MTRTDKIEIMAAELAKCEQMTLADCRRWIERCVVAVEEQWLASEEQRLKGAGTHYGDYV